MKIIDIHTHIYPDKVSQKATDSIRNFYEVDGSDMNGSVSMLLNRGAEAGISHFVVLPVANSPTRVHAINEFILEQDKQHDCFTTFGTLHADMEGLEQEVEWILKNDLKGIKLHPDCQRFAIDDPRLYPVYDAIRGKIPLLLHMGDRRYNFSHPARLSKVLDEFPDLQVIAAHFGGYTMYQEAREVLWTKDCVFDISSSLMFMEPGVAEQYINGYGAERMAYGTDYPLWDPMKEVRSFLNLKLTDDQFEQIAHKTAERVLKLK